MLSLLPCRIAFALMHRCGVHASRRFSRSWCAVALSVLAWNAPVHAQSSEVYVCAGPNGVPEYRNNSAGKRCKRLDLPDVVTVPGARAANPQTARRGGHGGGAPAGDVAQSSFPRVDGATQRSRDGERRSVLEQELQAEEARLAGLRAEYDAGRPERVGGERNNQKYQERAAALRDDIVRSEANTASLRRELNKLK